MWTGHTSAGSLTDRGLLVIGIEMERTITHKELQFKAVVDAQNR
jgi:hypothetical protein